MSFTGLLGRSCLFISHKCTVKISVYSQVQIGPHHLSTGGLCNPTAVPWRYGTGTRRSCFPLSDSPAQYEALLEPANKLPGKKKKSETFIFIFGKAQQMIISSPVTVSVIKGGGVVEWRRTCKTAVHTTRFPEEISLNIALFLWLAYYITTSRHMLLLELLTLIIWALSKYILYP